MVVRRGRYFWRSSSEPKLSIIHEAMLWIDI
jgi:hypothetical protein